MTVTVAHYLDSREFSGAERALLHLLAGLDRRRWSPVLLHHDEAALGRLLDGAHALEVPTRVVPTMRGLSGGLAMPRASAVIRDVHPEIFHAHLTWPIGCTWGLLAARLAGVRATAATVQLGGYIPRSPIPSIERKLAPRLVDRYIAVSRGIAVELKDWIGVRESEARVIFNGIEVPPSATEDRTATTALRRELGVAGAMVLSVARLAQQKGQKCAIDAACRLPEATFVFAGEGPDRAALEAYARGRGVGERVRFVGNRSDVRALLSACDVFILPSLYEGLPLSILEAMAAGKPVVASNIPGNNEAVVHEQTGLLVPPDRAEQLAGAIRSVLEEPELARMMGECGRRRVETRFTLQRMATDVGAVYDELLARAGRNA